MNIIYYNKKHQPVFQDFVINHPFFSLWQSFEWKNFQESIGRKTFLIGVQEKKKMLGAALFIKHPLPLKKSWIEIPRGPLCTDQKALKPLFLEIRKIAEKEKSIFCRFNPFQVLDFDFVQSHKAHADYHPGCSLLLDLSLSVEKLLKQMKPKGRYNIRLAEKKGVEVFETNNVGSFYKLLKKTWERDKFSGHSEEYYQKILLSLKDKAKLYLAKYEGEVIAGGIFTFVSDTAVYYYGASSNEYRNVMAPYLVQWAAIKEAKKRGCKWFDFLGIAPPGKEKGHAWGGVTEFKRKFGGIVKKYPEAREMVYKSLWYAGIKRVKKLRD